MKAKKCDWTVSADVLLPVLITVKARSAEEAEAIVNAMSPRELHEQWGGDTSSIGVSIDYVEKAENEEE